MLKMASTVLYIVTFSNMIVANYIKKLIFLFINNICILLINGKTNRDR